MRLHRNPSHTRPHSTIAATISLPARPGAMSRRRRNPRSPHGKPGIFDGELLRRWLDGLGLDAASVEPRIYRAVVRGMRDFAVPIDLESDEARPAAVESAIWETTQAFGSRPQMQLSRRLLAGLRDEFALFTTSVCDTLESRGGDTTKCVIELHDGERVESVSMRHSNDASEPNRTTVCVSSQIGCQMGCKFCATGTMGIIGDLTSCEIIEQVAHATIHERLANRESPKNVVFMGAHAC